MKKKYIIIIAVVVIVVSQLIMALQIEMDMSHIGQPPHMHTEFFGMTIPLGGVNLITLSVSWGIMALLIIGSFLVTRKLQEVPGRWQALFEMILEGFDKICFDTLGAKGRLFMPYVTTLFLFILLSNWTGILPKIPFIHIEEPTRDLNTTLGLGVIAFFVSHIAAIKYKGFVRYLADYFEPMFEIKGVKIPNIPFAPLNVIGELGKLVSHSFRLYGNILGGAIIIQVISSLTRYMILPIGLNFFFGLFVGAVQAFVFAMLALTYIAVLVEE